MSRLAGPHSEELFRFAARRTRKPEDAEDLVQETYLRTRVWEKRDGVENELKWLYGSAKHVMYDIYTSSGEMFNALVTYSNEAVQESALPDQDDIARLDAISEVQYLLDKLPPVYRAVMVLHKLEGYRYDEVAEKLGLSIHTVEKYVTRSLQQMRGQGSVYDLEHAAVERRKQRALKSNNSNSSGDPT